jgi:lipoprotein-anchoring transpeptidase ErfK/SrfK
MRILGVLFAVALGVFATAQSAQAVTINVDLSGQTMHVTSASGESYTWAVSSGAAGFNTPRGYYKPTSLQRMHYSRKYHMSPMPHSIFFRGGYAIHGTSSVGALGRPASHGCVRLAPANAAKLFAMVQREGARISITGTPGGSRMFAKRHSSSALAYAPQKRGKSVKQFMRNPTRF